ncbi:aromatic ring-hydroxylating dioxygenase subunit alpha [Synechocystis sp. FACHB-383]|uniref:aromatic ring-hydroxylating oxygenase subunit alpha n=1 Tax=Synechocystis sp. FACHB-383 TaxID=2692864 RepID=UPI0016883E5B|nr:aromatic ring-hydroxylating dioxygenase subunit alpha [Synechocystis sp. FACHB-383]MBD2652724.1 aromatic ring-hydroxylating dioxygenase subunit alpha [Synechocystis sp. FACHB-383]
MDIFNNWQIIAKGWYIVCPSQTLRHGQAKSITLCGQKIVVFRGQDGKVRALHAYCPHLGTDLGLGQVEGNWIRCNFHRWAFDETGKCRHIPCQSTIPSKAKLASYATAEKYGFIWVFPEAIAPHDLPEFDEIQGKKLIIQADKAFERKCHHHICMMNGIDAQHLKTIHHLDIKMDLSLRQNESGTQIDFTMKGNVPNTTFRESLVHYFLGETYEYSMRYDNGCIGLLTIMKNVRFFPPLHMIYAYTPLPSLQADGVNTELSKIRIQPIYVTAKRPGIIGYLVSHFLLFCTRLAYYFLRHEDGLIYDNIKFKPNILLSVDKPLAHYISYVNHLEPSAWSRQRKTG